MLQKVLDYRERIRKVKEEEKLKWGMLLHGADIRKPPRVIRETEAVETELDASLEPAGNWATAAGFPRNDRARAQGIC